MNYKKITRFILISINIISSGVFLSCRSAAIVTIWTDQPAFALYGDYFNTAQNKYKTEVFYFENVAEHLAQTKPKGKTAPDIIIGNWLTSTDIISLFKPILPYYKKNIENIFYPEILKAGQQKNKQMLLPVSFDMYAVFFDRNNSNLLPDGFSLSLNDLRTISENYNIMQNGAWTRLGFSPLWEENFLFLCTELNGVNWNEANPLSWEEEALDNTINEIREWMISANDSIQSDDDFSFKYTYEPAVKLVSSGKVLFGFSRISDFFKLSPEQKNTLDFRWIEEKEIIFPNEEIVYYGIYKNSRSKKAAAAFTNWFFNAETQGSILTRGKETRINEIIFGISGGLSAMINVTQTIFAQIYPEILGAAPFPEKLSNPGEFPPSFPEIKERVIIPYLNESVRLSSYSKRRSLETQLSDWGRSGWFD